jgi:hypothetical protein
LMTEYFPRSSQRSVIRPNFPQGTIVTWSTDENSWVKSLEQKFGKGPFIVAQTRHATYGTPQVRLSTENGCELVYSDGQVWFYKTWLVEN